MMGPRTISSSEHGDLSSGGDPHGESTENHRLDADGQLELLHERAASEDRSANSLRRVYDSIEERHASLSDEK